MIRLLQRTLIMLSQTLLLLYQFRASMALPQDKSPSFMALFSF